MTESSILRIKFEISRRLMELLKSPDAWPPEIEDILFGEENLYDKGVPPEVEYRLADFERILERFWACSVMAGKKLIELAGQQGEPISVVISACISTGYFDELTSDRSAHRELVEIFIKAAEAEDGFAKAV